MSATSAVTSELKMILEVAILNVKPGQERGFETAFGKAQVIIAGMTRYVSHQLQHCIEFAET